MFECYFDDSGTHQGSQIVAWGGLVGSAEQFDAFTSEWNSILRSPLDGKEPIRKMRLSSLRTAKGEFFGYSQGEIDLLTRKFRNVIVSSGLECVAYIVSCDDWLKASTPLDRLYLGDARNFAFQGVLEFVAAAAKVSGEQISCHLDIGARDLAMNVIEAAWRVVREEEYRNTHFTYSAVEVVLPLQGADMVAYEAYHYGLHLIDPQQYSENPHFVDLRNRTNVAFMSLHEPEMLAHLKEWRLVMADVFRSFGDLD